MSKRMTWRYHATKAPKMVPMDDTEQLEQLEAEGWADTPAAFHDLDAPEPDTEQGDLADMTKDDLLALAHSMELNVSTRTAKADLIAAITDAQG